jgi:hypothetical protein
MILFKIAGLCFLFAYGVFILLFLGMAVYWFVCTIKGE